MPDTATRTSARDFGRKSSKQTANRSRTHANQEGGSIFNASKNRDHGDSDNVVHDALETTNFQASASPSNQFPPATRALDHLDQDLPSNTTVQEDTGLRSHPRNIFEPESVNYFPGAPLTWEWDSPEDFQDIAQNYEPQGELVNEVEGQRSLEHDFNFREVVTDNPQIQGYFSNQSTALPFDHPHLPGQSLQRREPDVTGPRNPSAHTSGEKRKSIAATEVESSGPQGDSTVKRVAFSSPEKPTSASATTSTGRPVQRHQDGGTIRGGSEGPEPEGVQAEGSRTKQSASNEPPAKRSKHNSRRDKSGEKKMALPAGKVFPIQIGSELFRLSGASISSDAPSYFSDFFGEQLRSTEDGGVSIKTLYIDRDPITFKDISLHLQGYHVQPRDGEHFVKLFADAQFYSCMTSHIHAIIDSANIGDRHFQVPRDIFNAPGDNPNYFSLGFAVFFSTPNEVFPGLDQRGLLRPPSIVPPAVLNRSADIFAELLQILQGYPIHIRNDAHRAALLRDARYFHLKGLEQKLIPHHISYNNILSQSEIIIRLEDIRQSGISFSPDAPTTTTSSAGPTAGASPAGGGGGGGSSSASVSASASASRPSPAPSSTASNPGATTATAGPTTSINPGPGWIHYARPYVDETPHQLILEIGSEATCLDFSVAPPRAAFAGKTHDRVSALLGVVASKMNLPATGQPLGLMMLQSGGVGGLATQAVSPGMSGLSEERVKVVLEEGVADVRVDGRVWEGERGAEKGEAEVEEFEAIFEFEGREGRGRARKRKKVEVEEEANMGMVGVEGERSKSWIVKNGHWRLRAQQDGKGGMEVVLVAVKIEAYTSEKPRNAQRTFLG
ncbi:MAG: hypothetical protein Q9165_005614 [Trypethelium subeluteriae]